MKILFISAEFRRLIRFSSSVMGVEYISWFEAEIIT